MNNLNFIKAQKVAYTHSGMFHADDLLASALVLNLNPELIIKHIPNADAIDPDKCLIYDIGGGKYDHHCIPLKTRKNNIPYAAFGLLYKDLKYDLFTDAEAADMYDDIFVSECDRCDNSADTNILETALKFCNPAWNEEKSADTSFLHTVDLLIPLLQSSISYFDRTKYVPKFNTLMPTYITEALDDLIREKYPDYINKNIGTFQYMTMNRLSILTDNPEGVWKFIFNFQKVYGKYKTNPLLMLIQGGDHKDVKNFFKEMIRRKIIQQKAYEDADIELEKRYKKGDSYLLLNKYIPYQNFTNKERKIKIVAFPSERGGYCVSYCSLSPEEKKEKGITGGTIYRELFPQELRGKEFNDRKDGITFVHKGGHMAIFKDLNSVMGYINAINK